MTEFEQAALAAELQRLSDRMDDLTEWMSREAALSPEASEAEAWRSRQERIANAARAVRTIRSEVRP
jgi:DNA repair exonuclease SbcCD ATPase subunit